MQTPTKRESLLERRQQNDFTKESLWDKLSIEQKFAASSLTQFGYDLTYIRNSNAGSLAILVSSDSTATISNEGEVNTSSDIVIRA